MRYRTRHLFAFTLGLAACACQSSNGGDTGLSNDVGADASADAGGDVIADVPQDSGTDAGSTECNALMNIGAVVPQMNVATGPVMGSGGVIAPGMYVLTAAAVYTGPGGSVGATGTTFADTVVLTSEGAYERVVSVMNGPGPDGTFHQNGSFTTAGASLEVTQTCPPAPQPFTSFDSDGTTLRIYAPAGALGPGLMFEYTRR